MLKNFASIIPIRVEYLCSFGNIYRCNFVRSTRGQVQKMSIPFAKEYPYPVVPGLLAKGHSTSQRSQCSEVGHLREVSYFRNQEILDE